MKVSVSVTNYSWHEPIHERLAALAAFLDGTAVDTLWVADHLLQADPSSATDEPMLEAYTALGYLAAATRRIRLGTMVTAATIRAPALLIKAVTTLDVLSNGRAWLGLGAGYNAAEATAMGLFLPDTTERFARMAELLQLAHQMWRGDESAFRGEYLTLQRPIGRPVPVSAARCASSHSTAMPATCSTSPTVAGPSAVSLRCWTGTATTSADRPRQCTAR
jgi:alkanesulfonate monooxygenase SsuD/methylene tetrahydromethanopterin reductase-like flavin-dependent oxidoreductase (luciferase family)